MARRAVARARRRRTRSRTAPGPCADRVGGERGRGARAPPAAPDVVYMPRATVMMYVGLLYFDVGLPCHASYKSTLAWPWMRCRATGRAHACRPFARLLVLRPSVSLPRRRPPDSEYTPLPCTVYAVPRRDARARPPHRTRHTADLHVTGRFGDKCGSAAPGCFDWQAVNGRDLAAGSRSAEPIGIGIGIGTSSHFALASSVFANRFTISGDQR